MKHHESIHGERLAMGWHLVWAVLCFNTLCFSLGVLAMVWPYISVGKALLALACALVGQCVMSAGGVLWHVFGAVEHHRAIVMPGKTTTFTYHSTVPADFTKMDKQRISDVLRGQILKGFHVGGIVHSAPLCFNCKKPKVQHFGNNKWCTPVTDGKSFDTFTEPEAKPRTRTMSTGYAG
jgi:hypothetical protein